MRHDWQRNYRHLLAYIRGRRKSAALECASMRFVSLGLLFETRFGFMQPGEGCQEYFELSSLALAMTRPHCFFANQFFEMSLGLSVLHVAFVERTSEVLPAAGKWPDISAIVSVLWWWFFLGWVNQISRRFHSFLPRCWRVTIRRLFLGTL